MGGGGSIQGMRNSLNINNKLLRKQRYFKKEKSYLKRKTDYIHASGGIENLKSATPEQLASIRKKVIRQHRLEIIPTFIIGTVLLIILGYFIFDYTTTTKQLDITKASNELNAKHEKYLWYISEADDYLEKGKWHNAIFQYERALDLFPQDYHGQYRLAYAQTYRCRNELKNCEEAALNVRKLLKSFPNKLELVELEQVLIFVDK